MFDRLEFILRVGSGAHMRPANIDGDYRGHNRNYTVWLFLPGGLYRIKHVSLKKAQSNLCTVLRLFDSILG